MVLSAMIVDLDNCPEASPSWIGVFGPKVHRGERSQFENATWRRCWSLHGMCFADRAVPYRVAAVFHKSEFHVDDPGGRMQARSERSSHGLNNACRPRGMHTIQYIQVRRGGVVCEARNGQQRYRDCVLTVDRFPAVRVSCWLRSHAGLWLPVPSARWITSGLSSAHVRKTRSWTLEIGTVLRLDCTEESVAQRANQRAGSCIHAFPLGWCFVGLGRRPSKKGSDGNRGNQTLPAKFWGPCRPLEPALANARC